MIDLDTDTDSRAEGRDQHEEGSFSDRDDTEGKEPDGVCDREQQREGTSRGSAKAPPLPAGGTRLTKDDISEVIASSNFFPLIFQFSSSLYK